MASNSHANNAAKVEQNTTQINSPSSQALSLPQSIDSYSPITNKLPTIEAMTAELKSIVKEKEKFVVITIGCPEKGQKMLIAREYESHQAIKQVTTVTLEHFTKISDKAYIFNVIVKYDNLGSTQYLHGKLKIDESNIENGGINGNVIRGTLMNASIITNNGIIYRLNGVSFSGHTGSGGELISGELTFLAASIGNNPNIIVATLANDPAKYTTINTGLFEKPETKTAAQKPSDDSSNCLIVKTFSYINSDKTISQTIDHNTKIDFYEGVGSAEHDCNHETCKMFYAIAKFKRIPEYAEKFISKVEESFGTDKTTICDLDKISVKDGEVNMEITGLKRLISKNNDYKVYSIFEMEVHHILMKGRDVFKTLFKRAELNIERESINLILLPSKVGKDIYKSQRSVHCGRHSEKYYKSLEDLVLKEFELGVPNKDELQNYIKIPRGTVEIDEAQKQIKIKEEANIAMCINVLRQGLKEGKIALNKAND